MTPPDDTSAAPQRVFDVAMKVITKRRWRVVDAQPPHDADAGAGTDPRAAKDGVIEAVARSLVLGFPEDVVVRIRPTSDGTRIDVRSASRYGRNDLGSNAARVRDLVSDIDDILTAPAPGSEEEKEPEPPPKKPARPQGKGRSVRR